MKLIDCSVCEHVYLPEAHSGHCPVCGCAPFVVLGRKFHVDMNSGREVILSGRVWESISARVRVRQPRVGDV